MPGRIEHQLTETHRGLPELARGDVVGTTGSAFGLDLITGPLVDCCAAVTFAAPATGAPQLAQNEPPLDSVPQRAHEVGLGGRISFTPHCPQKLAPGGAAALHWWQFIFGAVFFFAFDVESPNGLCEKNIENFFEHKKI